MNSRLHIQAHFADGITRLNKTYFTPPCKVANITEDKKSSWLQLMIMNSSPGILDGDDYEMLIELDKGSCLQLHSQSYQRLFQMKKGASQRSIIRLANNCSFTYIPHPCVPHEHSIFKSINKIHLSAGCNLIWGEVLTCGRKLNGEVFRFSSYHTITEIFKENRLIIKENLLMQPASTDPAKIGQLEGYTHQASFIYLPAAGIRPGLLDTVHDWLLKQPDLVFGITQAGEGMVVRLLGNGAESLHQCLLTIARLLQEYSFIEPAKLMHAS